MKTYAPSGLSVWTPLHLMLFLHYTVIAEPWPNFLAPAVVEYTQHLIDAGLIRSDAGSESGYSATSRGMLFLSKLKNIAP